MRPLIGITGNTMTYQDKSDSFPFDLDYSLNNFSQAIYHAGGLPVVIPIHDPSISRDYIKKIDGLILTGGEDISPQLYEAQPELGLGPTKLSRDISEAQLFNEAIQENKAILGICRGLQIINVCLGGNLYQDLNKEKFVTIQHRQAGHPSQVHHHIQIDTQSYLGGILGSSLQVNSYHHQAINKLAPTLNAVAYSHDQIVEAVEWMDDEHSILALQWHPEMIDIKESQSLNIFKDLIQRAK